MEIYLLRHGIAEEAEVGISDSDRALTVKGERKLREVLERARGAGVDPTVILTSPLLRARQTAQVAGEVLGRRNSLVDCPALEPGASPEQVWEAIRDHKDARSVMLVGHEPQFSALYAYLLNAPSLQVNVKKGSLGRIDVERPGSSPRGVLRWLITPSTVE